MTLDCIWFDLYLRRCVRLSSAPVALRRTRMSGDCASDRRGLMAPHSTIVCLFLSEGRTMDQINVKLPDHTEIKTVRKPIVQ